MNNYSDPWHYRRLALAEQVLQMFLTGLSSALVFFAPRRMGKTEFLLKDMTPLAEKKGWQVFYFSFLGSNDTVAEFTQALGKFAETTSALKKATKIFNRISKISGEAAGIKAGVELNNASIKYESIKDLVSRISKRGKALLLLDEVQTLSQDSANTKFIAKLRTALDLHKDQVKVIFTGSSQEGLRRMFSQANAPFFHFGQNLAFPELDREFTDHLIKMFNEVTKRELNADLFWQVFVSMHKVPQLARALIERLALNPDLSLEQAHKKLLTEVYDDRTFANIWQRCSTLEQLLLYKIAIGETNFFSQENRQFLAQQLGIKTLGVPSIQSALRVLQRKGLIGRLAERSGYVIDDPNLKSWLLTRELS